MGKIEKKKIGSAIVMIPPVIVLIALGPAAALIVMVLIATFLGLREFFQLALPQSSKVERFVGIGLGIILSLWVTFGDLERFFPLIVFLLMILCLLFMGTSKNLSSTISNLGIAFFGIFYVGFLLAHVSLVRNMIDGRLWILFLIVTVWAGDIFALFIGSRFGRHKLYPKISPNKTYEGLGGAILGSMITALIFALLFIPHLEKGPCILLAIGIAVLGQLGDFTESMLKRSAQVKDSGSLIPGHGGMLDRLDSFFFAAPFFYYLLPYLLKETP